MRKGFAKFMLDCIYALRGENVWDILRKIEQNQWLAPSSIKELQWAKLKKTIDFAFSNIPYYRKLWQNIKLNPGDIQSFEDIKSIPIIYKEHIKDNRHILKLQDIKIRTSIRKTSGSTGIPLEIEKDRKTTAYMDAIMYRSYKWYGILQAERQLRIWGTEIDPIGKFKMHIKDSLLNRIRLSAFDLNRKSFLNILKKIEIFRPTFVYGYAQSAYEFAKFIIDEKKDLNHLKFKAAIITGEMIFDWQKEIIRQAFKCPVVNEYGCTEVGIIAIECPMGGMHIMSDNLFVEFIKNGGCSEQGEIVVTELNNFYSPLIRYKVGDKGIPLNNHCTCGRGLPLMASIEGRADEFIVFPNGRKVDPYVFENIIKKIPSKFGTINQFLIIQDNVSCLNLKLVCDTSSRLELIKALNDSWVKLYSDNLPLKIEFLNTIPKNTSGKLTCFKSFLNK